MSVRTQTRAKNAWLNWKDLNAADKLIGGEQILMGIYNSANINDVPKENLKRDSEQLMKIIDNYSKIYNSNEN